MRRRTFPLILALAACAEPASPRVGVVVSASPSHAVAVALELAGDPAPYEAVVMPTPEGTSSQVALDIAEELVRDPSMIAVIGHSNSAASLAASQVYNGARVVQIAPTSTAPVYDQAGPFSFRLVPSDTAQARFIAQAVQHAWPDAQRVAVVYVNDDYGRGLYRHARPRLSNVVFEGMYADVADTTNLYSLGDRVAAAQPDVLVWLGRPWRLRNLLARLRPALPDVAVLCSDACDEPTFYINEGGEFDGVRFVRFLDPEANTEMLKPFRDAYLARTDEMATLEALLTRDAAALIAAAIHDGAGTGRELREWLVSLGRSRPPFAGFSGSITFDDAGTVRREYLLADVIGPQRVIAVPSPPRRSRC